MAMKTGKPTSVLVFLGSCLLFAESLAGVARYLDKSMSGLWVLAFGTINLVLVVGALLFMFWYKPEFLTAERGDIVMLRAIEAIVAHNDPKLVRELIRKVDWRRVVAGDELPDVGPDESSSASGERGLIEQMQARIRERQQPGGGP